MIAQGFLNHFLRTANLDVHVHGFVLKSHKNETFNVITFW